MIELNDRTRAIMERALEETCRKLPHGGSHEVRSFIASRLIHTAWTGHATLGELSIVARKGLAEYRTNSRIDVASQKPLNRRFSIIAHRPHGARSIPEIAWHRNKR